MIKILAKNIRQHSKLNMMIEMNLKWYFLLTQFNV